MLKFLNISLVLMFVVPSFANRYPVGPILGISIFSAGTVGLNTVAALYSKKAREVILQEDPNSDLTPPAERSLMGSTVGHGIAAGILCLATYVGVFSRPGPTMAATLSVFGSLFSLSGVVTSAIAFGIEDNHRYTYNVTNSSSYQKVGSSNSEFPIVLGTSIGGHVTNVLTAAAYISLAGYYRL